MAHAHVPHPHMPDIRGGQDGSPWLLLPGVVVVLALVIAVLTTLSFVFAEVLAGRAY